MTTVSAPPTLAALLADGAWHSGPTLAARLGVTRAAVSARVRALRRIGLDIHSVAGRGYRLAKRLDLLDDARIEAQLSSATRSALADLRVLERTDSTNAELKRSADGGTRACLAEYQSAGRGRAQRAWASPFGANLYLSLAYDLAAPKAPLGALSLAMGVKLVAALSALGAHGLGLKWPNDIWAGQRKLGGILIEHHGEVGGRVRVIVGVGLNIAMNASQAAAVDQSWTRLADHMREPVDRNRVAAAALDAVMDGLLCFERDGFEPFRARWSGYDIARDRAVRIIEADGEHHGVARGIAADGALQVEIRGQVRSVYSGDVSLRLGPASAAS